MLPCYLATSGSYRAPCPAHPATVPASARQRLSCNAVAVQADSETLLAAPRPVRIPVTDDEPAESLTEVKRDGDKRQPNRWTPNINRMNGQRRFNGQQRDNGFNRQNYNRNSSSRDQDGGSPLPYAGKEQVPITNPGFKTGDQVVGRVVWANQHGARVEFLDHEGVIAYMPAAESPFQVREVVDDTRKRIRPKECLPIGLVREFTVIKFPQEGMTTWGRGPVVSAGKADWNMLWHRCSQMKEFSEEHREVFRVPIHGANDGGLLFTLGGLRGFVPMAHIPKPEDGGWMTVQSAEEQYRGKNVDIAVFECSQKHTRLMGSILEGEINNRLRCLKLGSLVTGKVRRVEDWGVFVGIDGTFESGLLHISNVSRERIQSVDEVFTVDETVTAVIVGIDQDGSKIALSTADLEEEPGEMLYNKQAVFDNAPIVVEKVRERIARAMQDTEDDEDALYSSVLPDATIDGSIRA